jgi:hypothetical protein
MAASECIPRVRPTWVLAGALMVALAGCSSGSGRDPEPLPPQTATRHHPEQPPVAPEPTPAPPTPAKAPPSTTIVIESAEKAPPAEPSLVDAARKERERRTAITEPVVKLDNKNLGAFGADQKLTVAHPENSEGEEAAAADAETVVEGSGEDEHYWRDGARAIRERWALAVEDVDRLDSESADLRRQFYSEDDPYVRDEQIKPEWDRVLNDLDRARREASTAPHDLEAFIESGRRAGALPGWLREGMELEPEETTDDKGSEFGPAEPREPIVVERDPDDR